LGSPAQAANVIGKSTEFKIVLAHVVPRADLRLASGYRMRPMMRAVTVAPSQGVPMVMDRRVA